MKKFFVGLLSMFSIISLAACTNSNTSTKKESNTNEKETIDILDSELENQMVNIASFLDEATFAVLNYSSEESASASSLGSGVIYKKIINDNPILLLDDVMSELDSKRRDSLLEGIGDIQTIITCTGYDDFIRQRVAVDKIYKISDGRIV